MNRKQKLAKQKTPVVRKVELVSLKSEKKKRVRKPRAAKQLPGTVRSVMVPTAGVITRRVAPKFYPSTRGDGSITIDHREYLFDVNNVTFPGLAGYNAGGKPILMNPAYSTGTDFYRMATWLNTHAQKYDSYRINSLTLVYSPITGIQTSGKFYCAAVTDTNQQAPPDKRRILEMEHAMSCPLYGEAGKSVFYPIPADFYKGKNAVELYCRVDDTPFSGATVNNAASRLDYDFGQIFMAVSDPIPPNSSYGEVSIHYNVTFMHPVDSPTVAAPPPIIEAELPSYIIVSRISGATTWLSEAPLLILGSGPYGRTVNGNYGTVSAWSCYYQAPNLVCEFSFQAMYLPTATNPYHWGGDGYLFAIEIELEGTANNQFGTGGSDSFQSVTCSAPGAGASFLINEFALNDAFQRHADYTASFLVTYQPGNPTQLLPVKLLLSAVETANSNTGMSVSHTTSITLRQLPNGANF